ncbi:unnamed protein product [Ilex paraguariensis]|uniref:2-oxoacid dehydrogenase acyltransferase catalytic domain-containing protein n=1 Tax=Ilex paraguariensis TaxID=185542 RepID=A0ABC8TLL2_9AQUA
MNYFDHLEAAMQKHIEAQTVKVNSASAEEFWFDWWCRRWHGVATDLSDLERQQCTFTLSNLGMFGVDRFDAILPPGTGAIMAVGASQPSVVAT